MGIADPNDIAARAKSNVNGREGGFADRLLLPARTKKWKSFWGMRFEWVLAECMGAGLVEVFETGSVGLGVRAV